MADFAWTDAAVETLKRLRAERKSASQIGVEMGVSRNTIIGKCHRLGLKLEGSPRTFAGALAKDSAPPSPPRAEEPERKPDTDTAEADADRLARLQARQKAKAEQEAIRQALAERRREFAARGPVRFVETTQFHCLYIPGQPDGAETLCCGGLRVPGSSYCETHKALTNGVGTPGERRAVLLPAHHAATGAHQ